MHSSTQLLCVVDSNPAAQVISDALGVPRSATVQQMLAERCDPEAAINCTPNNMHVAISSKELLAAGIHVLVEKPISTTVESGRGLVAAAATLRPPPLLVAHHRRLSPYVTAARRALSESAIGRVIAVAGLWAAYEPPAYFEHPTAWRASADSGGPVLINLVHEVDTLQYLRGGHAAASRGPITRAHAEQTMSQRGHEAEEGAAILLRFASGVVGTFILSDACASAHNCESGTGENPLVPHAQKDFYRIFGTGGCLSVGDMLISACEQGGRTWPNPLAPTALAIGDETPFDE